MPGKNKLVSAKGLVPLPLGAKVNARNVVILSLATQPAQKITGKFEYRIVQIGYYDADSGMMYPILENYRTYVNPDIQYPDGVTPITLESPSPVPDRLKLSPSFLTEFAWQRYNKHADLFREAREDDSEKAVPDYAYVSSQGKVCMYAFNSPYEEYREDREIVQLGSYDDITGKMMVIDREWGDCFYQKYVDRSYVRKWSRPSNEQMIPEDKKVVDIPDFAYIVGGQYYYSWYKQYVLIREKDSPYPEYRDSDLLVCIGEMTDDADRMKTYDNYFRYLDRQPGVVYPPNRYVPSEDGLVQIPTGCHLWKNGYYYVTGSYIPNKALGNMGRYQVGEPCDRKNRMKPLRDYEIACIPGAPVEENRIPNFSGINYGEIKRNRLEEERLEHLKRFDDIQYNIRPGFSLIAYRFFEESGIDRILKELYGPIAANRIESIAAQQALDTSFPIEMIATDIYMPMFYMYANAFDEMELLVGISEHGTKPFYDRWVGLHEDLSSLLVTEVTPKVEIVGSYDEGFYYYTREEEFGGLPYLVFYDRKTDHYLCWTFPGVNNFEAYFDIGQYELARKSIPYESVKKAKVLISRLDVAPSDIIQREYETRGDITLDLYPLDDQVEPHFKKVEGKLDSDEYRTGRFDEYVTVEEITYNGIQGRLLIGLSPLYRHRLLEYGARDYLQSLKRYLNTISISDARMHRFNKYFILADGGKEDSFFHFHDYPCKATFAKNATKMFEREAGYYAMFTTDPTLTADDLIYLHYSINTNCGFFLNRIQSYTIGAENDLVKNSQKAIYMINLIARNLNAYLSNKLAFDQKDMSFGDQLTKLASATVFWNTSDPRLKYDLDEDQKRLFELFNVSEADLIDYARKCYETAHYFSEMECQDEEFSSRKDEYLWPTHDEGYLETDEEKKKRPPASMDELVIY